MTKASRLIEARESGFAVPAFFVVDAQVSDGNLESYIEARLQAVDFASVVEFAVRSSADSEDGDTSAHAGEFMTQLFVPRSGVVEAVRACRKSGGDDLMTVIVQIMIPASISGVAFSANPNGTLSEAVISVSSGAGTAVVGTLPTATYYYHLKDNLVRSSVEPGAPSLSATQLRAATQLIAACMKQFGLYIDIEFAFARDSDVGSNAGSRGGGGALWLLQVRPITTLNTQNLVVLDNHNITESYPGVSLPLTQSFVTVAYTNIFRGLLERMIGAHAAKRYYDVTQAMVRPFNGRMYYQVSSWYSILLLLPFRKKLLDVWQQMVGVDVRNLTAPVRPSGMSRICTVLFMLRLGKGLPAKMDELHETFLQTEAAFRENIKTAYSLDELHQLFDWLQQTILEKWDLTLANDMYAFIYTSLYEKAVGSSAALHSDGSLASMQLAAAYHELQQKAQAQGRALHTAKPDLERAMAEYIATYGDRVPGELKLETKTYRTHPELLTAQLETTDHSTAKATAGYNPESAKDLERPTHELIGESRKVSIYHKKALIGIAHREQSRLDRARIFGMVREIMLVAGRVLADTKVLKMPRDIFYLTLDEVWSGRVEGDIVEKRKRQAALQESQTSASRYIFPHDGIVETASLKTEFFDTENTRLLLGTGCSSGEVVGEAVVIMDTANAGSVAGKVLITETTDPGWVFLLSQARAIVAEKGSLLSHTAIIARELGVPSVVGIERATLRIKSGDTVRVNGLTGEVEIMQ